MKPTLSSFSQGRQGELAQLNREVARLRQQPGMPALVAESLRFAGETLQQLASTQTRQARPRASQFASAPAPNPRITTFGA